MSALDRLREINAPPPPEDSIALRVAVLIAIESAAISVIQQDVGGTLLKLAAFVGVPAGFVLSHVARRADRFWLKVALSVGVLAAFANFLVSISNLGLSGAANVQIPLAELFLWVQFLHSLDVPARRDLLFSLVSSLVLIAVAGVLSISMAFAPWLALWAVAGVASLVLAYRRELAVSPRLGTLPTPADDARKVGRSAAAVVGALLVLGAIVFSLVPAAGGARAFTFPARLPESVAVPVPGGLSNPTLGRDDPGVRGPGGQRGDESLGERASFGYFGFSDSLDTSLRGRPDNTLVMRVRASRPDFWKGQTFDVWDGRTWTLSNPDPVDTLDGGPSFNVPRSGREYPGLFGEEFVQTYYVRKSGPNVIFAANVPTDVYFEDEQLQYMADGSMRTLTNVGDGGVYTVISRRPSSTARLLRATSTYAPDRPHPYDPERIPRSMARYLSQAAITERVAEHARAVTAGATSAYDQVRMLEQWMAANTQYTLDIPPLPRGVDAVEEFLFNEKKGFCEQIGTALVVMLRSLGVPARLALGYAAGQRNPFTGLYEVRASDAHSWAEVWFPGVGWQGFDPTASVPLAGEQDPPQAVDGAGRYLSVRLPSLPEQWPVIATGIVLLAAAVIVGQRLLSDARRRREEAARPWVERFTIALEKEGRARGRPRAPAETVREYTGALARGVLPEPGLDAVAAVVEQERFGPGTADEAARARAEAVLASATANWPA